MKRIEDLLSRETGDVVFEEFMSTLKANDAFQTQWTALRRQLPVSTPLLFLTYKHVLSSTLSRLIDNSPPEFGELFNKHFPELPAIILPPLRASNENPLTGDEVRARLRNLPNPMVAYLQFREALRERAEFQKQYNEQLQILPVAEASNFPSFIHTIAQTLARQMRLGTPEFRALVLDFFPSH